MAQKQLQITLTDTHGKSKTFALTAGEAGLITKPVSTDRGFGASHTDSAEIDGFLVSGDVWRFCEGTLGVKSLYEVLTAEHRSSNEFLEKFVARFHRTTEDAGALGEWGALVSADDELEGADEVLPNTVTHESPKG